MTERIYLVPGFFGFANLGEVRYFGHVRNALRDSFAGTARDVQVHTVRIPPTASVRTRAARLLESIAATAAGRGPIHLVGHSSGGLDVRLVLTPGVSLPTTRDVESIACRVRTAVSVSTPHHGTPVAAFLTGLLGQRLLPLLSLSTMYVLRYGRLPLEVVLRLGTTFARIDHRLGVNSALLDQLFGQLLGRFSIGRRRAIARLLADVRQDSALVTQLTPEAMDIFNAAVRPRPGVRYGCVVTRGRPPGVRTMFAAGLDPSAHATHAIYRALYGMAAGAARRRRQGLTDPQRAALRALYGKLPSSGANDGLVPTLSQVWGDVIAVARGDHLDVIGHFHDPAHAPPHFDWLSSGSGFQRPDFDAVWQGVTDYLATRPVRGGGLRVAVDGRRSPYPRGTRDRRRT